MSLLVCIDGVWFDEEFINRYPIVRKDEEFINRYPIARRDEDES